MQLQEQATGIAQHGANFISSPERRSRGCAVLASGLCGFAVIISHGRHD